MAMKKFTDVQLFWASVHTPNDMSGKYQVNLSNLTPAQIESLEDEGCSVRTKDNQPEMGTFITAKSSYPIKVVDTKGNLINDLVGNGSVADVLFTTYSGKNKFGSYAGISVKKIILKELVSYSEEETDEEVDEIL